MNKELKHHSFGDSIEINYISVILCVQVETRILDSLKPLQPPHPTFTRVSESIGYHR